MREDVQPSGLESHHTAHDVVEPFPFPWMSIVVMKKEGEGVEQARSL